MTAGIAVCGLGHAHPVFTAARRRAAAQLVHISNLYYNDQQILAAKAIVDRSFADRVFFCNSGAEANEGALKLARRYQAVVAGAPQRTKIVSTHGSFHGRTFATVAITGQPKYREGFGPLVAGVEHIPYGDLEAATQRARAAHGVLHHRRADPGRGWHRRRRRRATSPACADCATTPARS